MVISETANNVLGAVGGFCFAACLAPQVYKLLVTKSARDISYLFMALYLVGAIFLTIYLYTLGNAEVAFIAILVELVIAIFTVLVKIYLDIWGPYPYQSRSKTSATTGWKAGLKAAVRTDISAFFSGSGGAPFPLIHPSNTDHAAQHLLLDCTLNTLTKQQNGVDHTSDAKRTIGIRVNGNNSNNVHVVDDLRGAEEGGGGVVGNTYNNNTSLSTNNGYNNSSALENATELMKECLEKAGLELERSQFRQLPSFKSRKTFTENQQHQMAFIGCGDGYTTLIWYEESSTLAVDFFAASGEETASKMNEAAQLFGSGLMTLYPGSVIEAAMVPRLKTTKLH